MRVDLLKSIQENNDVTNVIILTHNIDLIFFQNIVIPSLRKCGHPSVTVFTDIKCSSDSFERQGKWLEGIGRRYRIVPVSTQPGFRFHPKAIFVSGREKASLFVGSGNVGFGGWRQNGEIWNRFDTESDDTGAFTSFHNYLNQIVKIVPLNDSILQEIQESFDPNTRSWVEDLNEADSLIGKVDKGISLIDQMFNVLEGRSVEKLTICSPYFDIEGEMVNELSIRSGAKSTDVLVQPQNTNLTQKAVGNFDDSVELRLVTFLSKEGSHNFLHAKFFAFQYGDLVTVFSGSSNCSKAALIIPESKGNVELMSYTTVSLEEFEREYVGELDLIENPPDLKEHFEIEEDDFASNSISLLGCRYDFGVLYIAFQVSEGIKVSRCIIDGIEFDFRLINESQLSVKILKCPTNVVLEGRLGTQKIVSNAGWVDHEMELRATSHQRRLAKSIHDGVNSENWGISSWYNILSLFHHHLKYLPKKIFSSGGNSSKETNGTPSTFSFDDIFTQEYGLPRNLFYHSSKSETDRLVGLQSMLLRWFGVGSYKDELIEEEIVQNEDNSDGEETVDQVEEISVQITKPSKSRPTDAENRRIKRIITSIVDVLTEKTYLNERHLTQLSADLSIVSLLLRSGLKEEWISPSDFLLFTHNVWSQLFFSSEARHESEKTQIGWLDYRYITSTDKSVFIEQLTDIRLAVSMTAWALALDEPTGLPEEALFTISCGISIAKFPYIWIGHDSEKFARELQNELIHTKDLVKGDEEKWNSFCEKREDLIRWGFALKKIENILKDIFPGNVKDKISRDKVEKGELLWQGKEIGLCISGEDCDRSIIRKITVHCLQHKKRKALFSAPYVIPLETLFSEKIISDDILSKDDKESVKDLIRSLTTMLESASILN